MRKPSLAVCLLALAAAGAGAAWACVPQPTVLLEPRASVRAGATVTVRGLNFNRPAEIRFNGVSGPRLKTAEGDQFRVKVRVPRASAGLYTLVALTRDQSGGVSSVASAPLEIRGPGGSSDSAGTAVRGQAGRSSGSSSDGVSPALAAGGGLGLLGLGGLAGALLARRRRPQPG